MVFNIFKKKKTKKDNPEQTLSQIGEVKPEVEKQPTKTISSSVTTLEPEYEEIMALGEKKPLINDPIESLLEDNIPITDIIAPKKIETDFDYVVVNDVFFRTLFASAYPRFVSAGWLEQIINFNSSLDVSFFIYPIEIKGMLDDLRHKIAEMEAELATDIERGKIVDPFTTSKLEDAQGLQEELVKGSEHIFEFAFYITIKAANLEQLNQISKLVVSTLSALPVTVKHATLDMSNAFITSLPLAVDNLSITRNMDTTALATTFPFTSTELSSDTGILYGINPQNDSFIIFDRFSLENSNMTIFATSGAGKSYLVKLESVRYLMLGTEIIIIDPENEYQTLSDAVGGQYIEFSYDSKSKINPFDLSQIREKGVNQLGIKILSLLSLLKIITGDISAQQEALLDRAINEAYRAKGITQDPDTQDREPPLMEDLYKALVGLETEPALDLAARLEKYVKGSFVGIFDQQTNIDINNSFTAFGIKNLEDALRPIAMFMILDYIWTRIRYDLKPRILIVDEAWHMMRYETSAQFLFSIAKRARKYYLGLTTITQDVEDFLSRDIGRAVVNNSALRVLLKQSPAAIDRVSEVFYLSQGEQQLLLGANIGEGIFFAGPNHSPIHIVASPEEHQLITTNPKEILERRNKDK